MICAVEPTLKKFVDRANELVNQPGWSQAKLAKRLGVHAPNLSKILSGKTVPYERTLILLNDKLDLILEMAADPVPSNFKIRMVSDVAAGDFDSTFDVDLMSEEGVPGALYPHPSHDPMLLTVVGSSMSSPGPDSIEEGDIVLFANSLQEEIPDGEIVVARHVRKKSHQIKLLKRLPGNQFSLVPANPKFKPVTVNAEEVVLRRVLLVIRRRYLRNKV